MKEILLKVKKRETGKQLTKLSRSKGMVPGVFYGKGEQPVSILTDELSLRPIVYTAQTKIVNLEIEGEENNHNCVLKEVEFHPVTDKIIHFDMLAIKPGQKLTIIVPIQLKGQAIGVRTGGIMQQLVFKIKVSCLPTDMLESIAVDVAPLQIGQNVMLKEVLPDTFDCELPGETLLCTVLAPRVTAKEETGGKEKKGKK